MKRKLHDLFRVSMPISLLFLWPFCAQAGEHNNIVVPDANVSFIENVGQMIDENNVPREDIDFRLQGTAVNMFVSNHGLQYVWTKALPLSAISSGRLEDTKTTRSKAPTFEVYNLYVEMIGANLSSKPETFNQYKYYENYYLPYCHGKTAHSYQKVVYKDIYPNIDWVLYTDEKERGGFKYDFIVHKGGKVSDIKLQYHGASTVQLNNGSLQVVTQAGNVTEKAPYSYDAVTGKEVSSHYTLHNNILGLEAEETENDLVIDPSISWATYYGNPKPCNATCVAADTFGNSFLCGNSDKNDNLVRFLASNTYQSTYGGNGDGWIVSLDITGKIRNFATYFGGNAIDEILAATCDLAGNLYVTGLTASMTGLAYGSPQQTTNDGNGLSGSSPTDGFLAKFQGSGYISWSTYVGGSQTDNCFAVAVDRSNGVYVGGTTSSTDTIPTSGAFNATGGDGFLIKYNQTTGRRIWGTFFTSQVDAIAVDNKQNVYIGGTTTKYTGIATTGPSIFQTTFNSGGATDGYVVRFNATNGARVWGTYYGGNVDDAVTSLVCDSLYNIYLGGTTTSTSANLVTSGALRSTPGTGILAKLDSSGARVWGTYYVAGISSMALGPDNKVYFGGQTDSTTDVATPGAYQASYTPPDFSASTTINDAFFGKLNNDGKRLWSSYFGGPNTEKNTTISYGFGRLYIGGYTDSKAGIATSGSLQDIMVDTSQKSLAYIAQFHSDTSVYIKFPYVDTLLCEGGPLDLKYGVTDTFNSNNVFTVQMSDINGSFANAVTIGTANTARQGVVHCTIPNPTADGVGYKLRIIASSPADTFYNYDMPIRVSQYPNPDIAQFGPVICENSTLIIADANVTIEPQGTTYIWTGPGGYVNFGQGAMSRLSVSLSDGGDYYVETNNHGCITRDTTPISITPSPADPVITGDTSVCIGDSLILYANSATSGVKYVWQGQLAGTYDTASRFAKGNIDMSNIGEIFVTATFDGCMSGTVSRSLIVYPLPYPSTFSNSPICSGDTLKFNATDTIAGVIYSWTGPNNFTSSSQNNVIPNATEPYTGNYKLTTTSIYGCKGSVNMKVNVNKLPEQVKAINNGPTCTGLDLQLNANNGTPNATYSWTGPNGYTSSQQNPYMSGVQLANQGLYTVVVDLNGCKKQDTTSVTIYQSPDTPKLSSNSPVKSGGIIKLFILNQQAGATYTWTGPNSFYSQFPNPVLNSVVPASAGVYKVVSTIGVCSNEDTITVKILDDSVRSEEPMVIFPNPNNGTFTIKGSTKTNENVEITIYASDGKEVFSDVVEPKNYMLNHTVHFTGAANGIYRLKLFVDRKVIYLSFTLGV